MTKDKEKQQILKIESRNYGIFGISDGKIKTVLINLMYKLNNLVIL